MHARSVMDGYAVRAADVAAATEQTPAVLRVAGVVPMGATFGGTVGAGQAVGISTGGFLPDGADAVVMIEHTRAARLTATVVIRTRGRRRRQRHPARRGRRHRRGADPGRAALAAAGHRGARDVRRGVGRRPSPAAHRRAVDRQRDLRRRRRAGARAGARRQRMGAGRAGRALPARSRPTAAWCATTRPSWRRRSRASCPLTTP